MNPPDWNGIRREPLHDFDRKQGAGTEKPVLINATDHGAQHGHYRYHHREPQRHTEWMEAGEEPSTPPSHSAREQSTDLRSDTTVNPGGPAVEVAEKGGELERKKKQLEEIYSRIVRTKAAIALKKMSPYLKKTDEPSDVLYDDQHENDENDFVDTRLTTDKEAPLKDRVKGLLKQKKSLGLPKVHCRDSTSSPKDGGGQQEEHPLKCRVKKRMNHRWRKNGENHSVPPPTAYHPSAAPEGFQHIQYPSVPASILNPSPVVPEQRPAAGFQDFRSHNGSGLNQGLATWREMEGQTAQVHPFPPTASNVPIPHRPPPTAVQHLQSPEERPRSPSPDPPLSRPTQRPGSPAGFLHLQKQSYSRRELSPANKTWGAEEGMKTQIHPLPTMPNDRPWTPSLDPSSSAPLQRPALAKGLQRFLNVLNKGVDINLFTSIMNDDGQSIPSSKDPLLKMPLNEPPKSENNWIDPHQNDICSRQAEQWCHSRSNSLGGSIELPNPEGSHKERNTPTNYKLNEEGSSPFPSGSAQSCLPAEETPTKLQLQTILKTLGLSFEADEISGLTNRTKERLYGKKKEHEQRLHKTSESEKPSPKICPSTSTSVPAIPPSLHPQEKDSSRECRNRGQISHDGQPRERSGDKDKMRNRDRCGDAETERRQYGDNREDVEDMWWDRDRRRAADTGQWQDRDHHKDAETDQWQYRDAETDQWKYRNHNGNAETEKSWGRDRHRDAETDKWRDRVWHRDAETDKRRDRGYTKDSETDRWRYRERRRDSAKYKRWDRDHGRDSETYKRWDRDHGRDLETYKRQDRDRRRDSETYMRRDGDCRRDSETYKRRDRDCRRDSETYKRRDRDCSGDSETYKRRDRDCRRDSETYKRRDRDCSIDSETYTRRDRDHSGDSETYKRRDRVPSRESETDKVKISSHNPDASVEIPNPNSALALPENTSNQDYQDTTNHGGAVNDSSHLTIVGPPTAPYPQLFSCPQNPPYPLPDTSVSSHYLPETVYSYNFTHPPACAYHLPETTSSHYFPGDVSSPAAPAEAVYLDYFFNPDLSKSEGQHWSAQRCLQVINITKPLSKVRCLATLTDGPRFFKHSNIRIRCKKSQKKRRKARAAKAAVAAQSLPVPVPVPPQAVPTPKEKQEAVKERELTEEEEIKAKEKQEAIKEKEPTEEEIKAKLKEKLQAFNQKMKLRPIIPVQESKGCTYTDLV